MADWPATLPQAFLVDTMTKTVQRNFNEFKPDNGRPLRARRYTGRTWLVTGEMLMTQAQRDILDDFFEDTLGAGSARFNMDNVITGDVQLVVMMEEWRSQCVAQGEYWRVALQFTMWDGSAGA